MFGAISNVCNHVGGPLGEAGSTAIHRLPLAQLEIPPLHRQGRARLRGGSRPCLSRCKVESGRVLVNLEPHNERAQEAARAASAGARRSSARRGRCASPASRRRRWTRQSALLRLRPSARRCARKHAQALRRRDAADHAQRLKFRACEGYYSKSRAGLHLAVLDHADGRRATRWTRSTRRWCTGPTRSSSRRRSAGARRRRSISRWSSG